MKKFIALFLALLMVASLVACGTPKDPVDTADTDDTTVGDTNESVADSETSDEGNTDAPAYDGVFQAGFGRIDITPDVPITLNTGVPLTNVLDRLYATCIAVHDGKDTALILTLDVKNMGTDFVDAAKKRIKTATGVPISNIMMSATHDHSAPNPANTTTALTKWTARLYNYIVDASEAAIEDLADAEVYIGTAKTTTMASVRRYIHEDGSFSSIHYRGASSTPVVKYETEADDTLQMLRFVRKDKKDIVMVNWQAHVAHAIGVYKDSITADLVNFVRRDVERDNDDVLLAYYQGASGNINLTEKVKDSSDFDGNYQKVGQGLADLILAALKKPDKNFTKVNPGKIQGKCFTYTTTYRVIDPDVLQRAQAVVDEAAKAGYAEGSEGYNALLDKYSMKSKYEVNKAISIAKQNGKEVSMPLVAISFGDIAFAAIPYEMFDTNGMELKEGSPFKMTFVLTCAGGAGGYVPSANSVPNGGYEVYTTGYKFGTAEEVVAELIEEFNKQKEKQFK